MCLKSPYFYSALINSWAKFIDISKTMKFYQKLEGTKIIYVFWNFLQNDTTFRILSPKDLEQFF